jgi:hypothetical protein
MGGADDGVSVDDRHDPVLVVIVIRLHNPHAIVGVGVVERFVEVMDKRT